MEESTLLEKVILGEVSGKNAAINAYDKIIWTIRSGFLTLVFVGWSVLLKSIAENNIDLGKVFVLSAGMLCVSLGLAIGGWFVDLNYLRRKFRVIVALNELMDAVKTSDGNASAIPSDLLKVAGDDANRSYDTSGYKEALMTSVVVYFAPLPTLATAAYFIVALYHKCPLPVG